MNKVEIAFLKLIFAIKMLLFSVVLNFAFCKQDKVSLKPGLPWPAFFIHPVLWHPKTRPFTSDFLNRGCIIQEDPAL